VDNLPIKPEENNSGLLDFFPDNYLPSIGKNLHYWQLILMGKPNDLISAK
jgi:hypothetical protein